ncbi:two-component system response regulator BaeR [Colwellia sp. 75C3]|uniref:response regulator n=1 Tax=Colwellia sp. 75C3 TaxID=888425 RepID=UPI000C31E405|nr:response regulator [Colwellia sp. 75C3]PKG82460.1 two-component system response regulator BaeR [Colwellia sp. 75C3]
MNKQTILIVEDDVEIAELVTLYLEAADYQVKWFDDGIGAVEWAQKNKPNLILLDLDLPVKQGLDVCKEVRCFSDIPIIMTTAKVEEIDRLVGLDIGADDYVCKPYSIKELVARVKVNLRRMKKFEPQSQLSGLVVDKKSFKITYKSNCIELTAIEFALFNLLYTNPNHIYSRSKIMDLVYQDYRDVSDRTVDSHIRNMRKKFKALSIENDVIRSIYGAGYKFEPL